MMNVNRGNIPAVCRIGVDGTGVLVQTGLLLTSRYVIDSKEAAKDLYAVFFEGTKKTIVKSKLLPERFIFIAQYPLHIDYCLIACEVQGLLNVVPIRIPITRNDLVPVHEGDTLLLVQSFHPSSKTEPESSLSGQKLFLEVTKKCDDHIYFPLQSFSSVGCPVFNEEGQFVGLQCQRYIPGEGHFNLAVLISSIVRHMFANGLLSKIPQDVCFAEFWETWYIPNDPLRTLMIRKNINTPSCRLDAGLKICEIFSSLQETDIKFPKEEMVKGILKILLEFPNQKELVLSGLKALWKLTLGDSKLYEVVEISDGISMLTEIMNSFRTVEGIQQYTIVLLHNVLSHSLSSKNEINEDLISKVISLTCLGLSSFPNIEVLQKFGIGLLSILIDNHYHLFSSEVKLSLYEHTYHLLCFKRSNVFLLEKLFHLISFLLGHFIADHIGPQQLLSFQEKDTIGFFADLIHPIVSIMNDYIDNTHIQQEGNEILWLLGINPFFRKTLLEIPGIFELLLESTRKLT